MSKNWCTACTDTFLLQSAIRSVSCSSSVEEQSRDDKLWRLASCLAISLAPVSAVPSEAFLPCQSYHHTNERARGARDSSDWRWESAERHRHNSKTNRGPGGYLSINAVSRARYECHTAEYELTAEWMCACACVGGLLHTVFCHGVPCLPLSIPIAL